MSMHRCVEYMSFSLVLSFPPFKILQLPSIGDSSSNLRSIQYCSELRPVLLKVLNVNNVFHDMLDLLYVITVDVAFDEFVQSS